MGFSPVPPKWDEMMSAEDRQAEAIASGAAATITAQIAGLESRPNVGYLAKDPPVAVRGREVIGYAIAVAVGIAFGRLFL